MVAAETASTSGSPLWVAGLAGAALAGTVRIVRDIDNVAVSRYVSGKGGPFSRLIYRSLKKTPLRVLSINEVARRIEWLQGRDKEAFALQQTKDRERTKALSTMAPTASQDAVSTTNDLMDARTIRYLSQASDHRKHLRHIMVVCLGLFTSLRMVSAVIAGQPLSAFQLASRNASFAAGMGFSLAQVDAYIQRRAAEPTPLPFFRMANKVAEKIWPVHKFSNWLIRRDYANIASLERGDQVWQWRAIKSIADKLPLAVARNFLSRQLEKRKLSISPVVRAVLIENKVDERIALTKSIVEKRVNDVAPADVDLRAAYADLVQRTDASIGSIREQYDAYKETIIKRNNKAGLKTPETRPSLASVMGAAVITGTTGLLLAATVDIDVGKAKFSGKYGTAMTESSFLGNELELRDKSGKIIYFSNGVEPTRLAVCAAARDFTVSGTKPSDQLFKADKSVVKENWFQLFGRHQLAVKLGPLKLDVSAPYQLTINGKKAVLPSVGDPLPNLRRAAARQLGYGS